MTTLEIKELSLVLVGKFNPLIFHPHWLARKSLITDTEAEAASNPEEAKKKKYINHPEVSQFSLGYCDVQVLLDNFTVSSTQEGYFTPIRDLVLNVFSILRETPIVQVGINLTHHYRFRDVESWHKYGHTLVPKEPLWKAISKNPGLKKLEIESERTDEFKGSVNIITGLSDRINAANFGIKLQINDHYNLFLREEEKQLDATRALKVLEQNWKRSIEISEQMIAGIIKHAS